jgi:mercuric ion transport protein
LTPYLSTEVSLTHGTRVGRSIQLNLNGSGRGALFAGGLAAILASTCCLGPLVLITLGVSGAWISNLTTARTVSACLHRRGAGGLFFAWRIWRPRR